MAHQQFDALRAVRFLKTPAEVRTFESTLAEIARQRNLPQSEVEDLFLLFEDSSAQQEVLWGLLHLIEDIDQSIWLPAFVAVLPEMKLKSSEWTDTVTSRILNGEHSRPAFTALLTDSPESRTAVLPILEELSRQQSPRLRRLRQNAEDLLADLRA